MSTPKPISRRKLANIFRSFTALDYVGHYGHSDVPYYARPGTTGNLFTDRVHAPVRTEVRYADNIQSSDNCIHPCGDVLRWLDEAPRGVMVVVPDYSGSHCHGEWLYYKGRDGQWQVLGYFQ